MSNVGKLLIVAGLLMAVVGLVVWGLGRAGFRGLPGDIRYESDNVRFYFPIVTCIVLSVILTAIMWLWQWLGRR
jgi:hypothetical protein